MSSSTPPRPAADADRPPRTSEAAPEFEELIADISGRFVTLPLEEIDGAATRALEPIGRVMGGDRCFIFLPSADDSHHVVAHLWTTEAIPDDPVVLGTVVQEGLPWGR